MSNLYFTSFWTDLRILYGFLHIYQIKPVSFKDIEIFVAHILVHIFGRSATPATKGLGPQKPPGILVHWVGLMASTISINQVLQKRIGWTPLLNTSNTVYVMVYYDVLKSGSINVRDHITFSCGVLRYPWLPYYWRTRS